MMTLAQLASPPRELPAASGDRERLCLAALGGFLSLADVWRLTNAEASALIGVSVSTLGRMKRTRRAQLRQDQLTRISALIGIFKGLHDRFAQDDADDWVLRPNPAAPFCRRSPLEAMIEGGIPHMLEARRHVDSLGG